MDNTKKTNSVEASVGIVFNSFLLWSFVLLCRPQDLFPFLSRFRPIFLLDIVVLVLWAINYNKLVKRPFRKNSQNKKFILFICVIALSIPFSLYVRQSFFFLLTVYINAILYYKIAIDLTTSIKKIKMMIFGFCFGMMIYSIFVILKGTYNGGRVVVGEMFDPNDLAFVLVSCWPMYLIFVTKENSLYLRIVGSMGILLSTVGIFLTASRGGILALTLAVLLLLVKTKYTIKRTSKYLILIAAVFLLLIFSNKINMERIMSITDLGKDYNMSDETGRIEIWKTGMRLMFTHPVTGVGVSCFSEAIGRDRERRGLQAIWQAPHNSLVQIGTETGILGLILFVSLSWKALSIFKELKKRAKDAMSKKVGEMVGVAFWAHLSASMFLSQAYSIYWVFFISLSTIMSKYLLENLDEVEAQ